MAAVTAINLRMLREIARIYEVDFAEDRVKAALGALAGGAGAGVLAQSAVATGLLRAVPVIGQTVAALRMSVYGSAFTYAVGKVFIQHYATGGTMLDFDPARVRAFFAEQFEKGKQVFRRQRPPAAEPA